MAINGAKCINSPPQTATATPASAPASASLPSYCPIFHTRVVDNDFKIVVSNVNEATLLHQERIQRSLFYNLYEIPNNFQEQAKLRKKQYIARSPTNKIDTPKSSVHMGEIEIPVTQSPIPMWPRFAHRNGNNAAAGTGTVAGTGAMAEPMCSGWLYLAKNGGKWKRVWCEYFDCLMTYRIDETSRKPNGSMEVTYCHIEYPPTQIRTEIILDAEKKDPHEGVHAAVKNMTAEGIPGNYINATQATANKYDELYWAFQALQQPWIVRSPTGGGGENGNGNANVVTTSPQPIYAFKVWSPGRVYLFRSETVEMRDLFVKTICNQLQKVVHANVWKAKIQAARALDPLLREQYIIHLHRYQLLVKALSKAGYLEDELPITSTRKDKSGVLCMETPWDVSRWRDYYFVLFEGSLFYYKDSKSTTPTGFVSLRYASVSLDARRLSCDEFVFRVVTPWRTIVCRTKHAVALSEWISVLENTLYAQQGKKRYDGDVQTAVPSQINGDVWISPRFNAALLFQDINLLISDVSTFDSLKNNSTGIDRFRNFLRTGRKYSNYLEFFLHTLHFFSLPQSPGSSTSVTAPLHSPTEGIQQIAAIQSYMRSAVEKPAQQTPPSMQTIPEVIQFALAIRDHFLMPDGPALLVGLPQAAIQRTLSDLDVISNASFGVFGVLYTASVIIGAMNHVRFAVYSLLNNEFTAFQNTEGYRLLRDATLNHSSNERRQVVRADSTLMPIFMLKVKGSKQSKEIKLTKKASILTIGRDKSNSLVVDDSRVSRSHARVEWHEQKCECEYIDLGSSCGSKLNGKMVHRQTLSTGDVLELGQSILVFMMKKKKSLFQSLRD